MNETEVSAPGVGEAEAAGAEPSVAWLRDVGRRSAMRVRRVPLAELDGWETDPDTGDIRHRSGRFFTVAGLSVEPQDGDARDTGPGWRQPIIDQPEVGVLGLLAKEFGGERHFLMQAKAEPGNHNEHQLSPTVQATRSNYTRVHRGRSVPYLGYFQDPRRHRVLADVRQSEQGAWFLRKRNRNMIVEVTDDVVLADGFRWTTRAELDRLLAAGDYVNMDARSVLSHLPPPGPPGTPRHSEGELLSWLTAHRCEEPLRVRRVPLRAVTGWVRTPEHIAHEQGRYFDVIGVHAESAHREVTSWQQPMLRPREGGVIAFLLRWFDGTPHVLTRVHREPGYADVAELGPTVQCTPGNYAHLPPSARPPLLAEVLAAPRSRILFDATLSEEGGRFYHARNRYLVVATDRDPESPTGDHRDLFRWVTPHQLAALLQHSHYVNVQARSLIACLHSLLSTPSAPSAPPGGFHGR
ncbi:NDP-hexose 2,3-dehydratase family protein [Streptomyces aurantiacus]|uniref:dTDP-4-dehydro-6-deoxy-alpha-D-glucopyranose 2,3-dehydratase domain-containing protein n=1 Tax=Streptomyces aurantiacus JA 4570 TaxID=1286094 RepID=S3ZJX9_9ACTN|nr:NDP-hexose 2,3-dehydratase family protein [Streptomyces aurantiacus]EPH43891.1 hypothetical protein STRAU_3043 [Streptomyces aurantiacus JA 4570]